MLLSQDSPYYFLYSSIFIILVALILSKMPTFPNSKYALPYLNNHNRIWMVNCIIKINIIQLVIFYVFNLILSCILVLLF